MYQSYGISKNNGTAAVAAVPQASSVFGKESVDLLDELICICTVNLASCLNALTSGCGASEAVHTDLKEELRSLDIKIKNIADD